MALLLTMDMTFCDVDGVVAVDVGGGRGHGAVMMVLFVSWVRGRGWCR